MARNWHGIHGYKMIIYSMKLKVKIGPTRLWENAEAGRQSQEQCVPEYNFSNLKNHTF